MKVLDSFANKVREDLKKIRATEIYAWEFPLAVVMVGLMFLFSETWDGYGISIFCAEIELTIIGIAWLICVLIFWKRGEYKRNL